MVGEEVLQLLNMILKDWSHIYSITDSDFRLSIIFRIVICLV